MARPTPICLAINPPVDRLDAVLAVQLAHGIARRERVAGVLAGDRGQLRTDGADLPVPALERVGAGASKTTQPARELAGAMLDRHRRRRHADVETLAGAPVNRDEAGEPAAGLSPRAQSTSKAQLAARTAGARNNAPNASANALSRARCGGRHRCRRRPDPPCPHPLCPAVSAGSSPVVPAVSAGPHPRCPQHQRRRRPRPRPRCRRRPRRCRDSTAPPGSTAPAGTSPARLRSRLRLRRAATASSPPNAPIITAASTVAASARRLRGAGDKPGPLKSA